MRSEITNGNPFGHDRYGFLWEVLRRRAPIGPHVDYGAFDGSVLRTLKESGVIQGGVGLDVNKNVVVKNGPLMPPGTVLLPIQPRASLPFRSSAFGSAGVLDVIEHVVDQRFVLSELRRVLCGGGLLIVTVPRQHLLSFLDTGNWKYRFPRLHRIAYTAAHGSDAYETRYVRCENGLFGDIEIGKETHEHFTVDSLCTLLREAGFEVVALDGAGFFARALILLDVVTGRRLARALGRAKEADARKFNSTHLFAVARPVANPPSFLEVSTHSAER